MSPTGHRLLMLPFPLHNGPHCQAGTRSLIRFIITVTYRLSEMLGSLGPQSSCSNANICCSSSSKRPCTLLTSTASQRARFTFASGSQRNPPHSTRGSLGCLVQQMETPPLTPFQCYLVNPLPPSLPPEPKPRGFQPHGTTCYLVATGFLHPVEPQAPLPSEYPADYTNCIADPAHSASCLTVLPCFHSSLNPWWARQELRDWKKMQGAVGTTEAVILSWLEQQP